MLFSPSAGVWKLADFGTCSEATSTRFNTTHESRGTPCYRAPEVLRVDDNRIFNNKADIWALGCIIYELFSGSKAFPSDWHVTEYSRDRNLNLPIPWPTQLVNNHGLRDEAYDQLQKLDTILSEVRTKMILMLCADPVYRPPAREILQAWSRLKEEYKVVAQEEEIRFEPIMDNASVINGRVRCARCKDQRLEVRTTLWPNR